MYQGWLSADEQNNSTPKTALSEYHILGLDSKQYSPSFEPLPPVSYMSSKVEGLSHVEGRLVQVQKAHVEPRAEHVPGEAAGMFENCSSKFATPRD